MKGLMQPFPLTLDLVLRHAIDLGATVEVVSATPGGIDRRTWRDVAQRAARVGGVLEELGVAPGGRVATFAWNSHRHVELLLGVPCNGRVVHPVNVRLLGDQVVQLMEHAGDEIVFVDASLTALLAPLRDRLPVQEVVVMEDGAEVDPAFADQPRYEELIAAQPAEPELPPLAEDDAAWICHTSGTTGLPKGIVSSHRSAVLHSLASMTIDNHAISRRDVVLPATPMFHVNAWGVPYTTALAPAKLVLPGRDTSPEALAELIENERVTLAGAVPTVLLRFVQDLGDAHDLSSLRTVIVGGQSPPRALVEALVERGIDFMLGYGMTETSPTGTSRHMRTMDDLAGDPPGAIVAVGHPTALIERRVVGDDGTVQPWDGESIGEIQFRGPHVIHAYLDPDDDSNEARFDDGWLRSGDIGRIAPDGGVEIVDRSKDLIKSGGEWISSLELEQAIAAHAAVSEVVVVAVPDERWGERPAAVVVAKPGASIDDGELRAFLGDRVAKWWLPDLVLLVPEIPKTPVGKYDKRLLREQLAADLAAKDVR
jgi:acyl-CoA synthetase (AMP-forming)/AMP-acid ligase II